jgi:hypothetical protein
MENARSQETAIPKEQRVALGAEPRRFGAKPGFSGKNFPATPELPRNTLTGQQKSHLDPIAPLPLNRGNHACLQAKLTRKRESAQRFRQSKLKLDCAGT